MLPVLVFLFVLVRAILTSSLLFPWIVKNDFPVPPQQSSAKIMNNGLKIHPNGLQPLTTASERLVSARKQSPALKAISRYNFPWTGTLTYLFNMQIHSNNPVALTTEVQSPNNSTCLQLGHRVVSSTCLSAFIVFNKTIKLPWCSFLKLEGIPKWKLCGIACKNFNLKFSLEKNKFRQMSLLE